MRARRRLIVHAGTPKTGSTTLQILLGRQTDSLAARGVLVPRTGRDEAHVGAHQALARTLLEDDDGPAAPDGSRALFAELDASPLATALVSSENFAWLALAPELSTRLYDGLAAIGYDVTILLYVRDQPGFAESAYAEFIKQGFAWDVDAYLDAVNDRTTGLDVNGFRFCFDYASLADRFAGVFGHANVVVRPFDPSAEPKTLLDDFSAVVGGGSGEPLLADDETLHNPRLTFVELLQRMYAHAANKPQGAPDPSALLRSAGANDERFARAPFAFLEPLEIERIRATFAGSNAELAARYAARIPLDAPRRPHGESAFQGSVLRAAARAWNLERI